MSLVINQSPWYVGEFKFLICIIVGGFFQSKIEADTCLGNSECEFLSIYVSQNTCENPSSLDYWSQGLFEKSGEFDQNTSENLLYTAHV